MATHDELLALRDRAQANVTAASAGLKAFAHLRAPNGLTPDAVKFSPEYRAAKSAYDQAFARLRAVNAAIRTTQRTAE